MFAPSRGAPRLTMTVSRPLPRPIERLMKLGRLVISPVLEFGRIVFFMRELDVGWSDPGSTPDVVMRLGVPADIPAIQAGRHDGKGLTALLRHRFERGDRAVLAIDRDHGAVLRSSWVSIIPTPIPEVNREFVPRPDEGYLYDGYTRRDVRSHGIDSLARRFIFSMLHREGYRRAYSYVRGNNRPALLAAARWQTPVAQMRYLSLRDVNPWVMGPFGVDTPSGSTDPGTWPRLLRPPRRPLAAPPRTTTQGDEPRIAA